MVRYREILRLTALGISQRGIAGSVGCSKTTVQEVQRKAAALRIGWPLPDEMGDEALRVFDSLSVAGRTFCPIPVNEKRPSRLLLPPKLVLPMHRH